MRRQQQRSVSNARMQALQRCLPLHELPGMLLSWVCFGQTAAHGGGIIRPIQSRSAVTTSHLFKGQHVGSKLRLCCHSRQLTSRLHLRQEVSTNALHHSCLHLLHQCSGRATLTLLSAAEHVHLLCTQRLDLTSQLLCCSTACLAWRCGARKLMRMVTFAPWTAIRM